MESATLLRQLLKSFCYDTPWNYALFWRLKHEPHLTLSWEDGYCNYSKPRDILQPLENDVYLGGIDICNASASEFDAFIEAGFSGGLSMENMSCLSYLYGDGMVGKVASTGMYSWVFLDELISDNLFNYMVDWHIQFEAGINTILLVPVLPHGVVQLGSLGVIPEDPTVVAHVKGLFVLLKNCCGTLEFTSPLPLLSSPLFEESSVANDLPDMNQTKLSMNDMFSNENEMACNMLPTSKFHVKQPLVVTNCASQGDILHKIDSLGLNLIKEDDFLDIDITANTFEISVDNLLIPDFKIENQEHFDDHSATPISLESYLEKEDSQNITICGYDVISPSSVIVQPLVDVNAEMIEDQLISSPPSSYMESQLQSIFASIAWKEDEPLLWTEKSLMSESDSYFQPGLTEVVDLVLEDSVTEASNVEHLVNAVVPKIRGSFVDDISDNLNGEKSSPDSLGQITTSCLTENKCENRSADVVNPSLLCHVESVALVAASGALPVSCPTGSFEKSTGTLINEGEYNFDAGCSPAKKSPMSSKVGKRKGRNPEVHRPRPRDRQMIQDRIKELREIVPGGDTGSIDALLERTANHMLFLQSVTSQAENLSKCSQSKEVYGVRVENNLESPLNDVHWNFGWEGQLDLFPITVENLDHPGHLLVEVLCEELSLFMEIVQVIRRLKLSILEGIMEGRSYRKWAHFIIEAPRGFQRVDILCPLMQLLQTRVTRHNMH